MTGVLLADNLVSMENFLKISSWVWKSVLTTLALTGCIFGINADGPQFMRDICIGDDLAVIWWRIGCVCFFVASTVVIWGVPFLLHRKKKRNQARVKVYSSNARIDHATRLLDRIRQVQMTELDDSTRNEKLNFIVDCEVRTMVLSVFKSDIHKQLMKCIKRSKKKHGFEGKISAVCEFLESLKTTELAILNSQQENPSST